MGYLTRLLTTGNRRNQHNLVAILKRVRIAAQKAYIFVVHVDVDEAPQLALLVLDLGRKRRKFAVNIGDQSRQIRSIGRELLLAVGVPRECGGKNDLDRNGVLLYYPIQGGC